MTDRIDAYCSLAHYQEHLQPILDALPDDRRGLLYGPRETARELLRDGTACEVGYGASPSSAPLLVAGFQDLRYGDRPKVLVQHGAGQTYGNCDRYGSYAGGPGHEAASLHLVPSERVAELERARYPQARAVAVGAPKLDGWARIPNPRNGVVAVTFHWDQYLRDNDDQPIPESGNALGEWWDTITAFAKQTARPILGHAHPRLARDMAAYWASIGVEYVPRAVDLLHRAEILVADNTSLAFEWAALDRPVVFLRGEGWRNIHGPPRFIDPAALDPLTDAAWPVSLPGPEIGTWAVRRGPQYAVRELADACETSRSRFVLAREAATVATYGSLPGGAAQRAADAILTTFG